MPEYILDDARYLVNNEEHWLKHFEGLNDQEKEELKEQLKDAPLAGPQPGPQAKAFECDADVLGYGGAAGGGKSALCILKAIHKHQRTVIFRKDAKQMSGMVDNMSEFLGHDLGLNRTRGTWYLPDKQGHLIEWGGIGDPGSEMNWRGREHDLLVVDEATEVNKDKIMYLRAWLRSASGHKCQTLFTFNPPGGPDDPSGGAGRWVKYYFGPWLDKNNPTYPAKSGEIRWFVTGSDGVDREVEDGEPREIVIRGEKEIIKPQSRTFIFATLKDNKYLGEAYFQSLATLPEPHRSKLMFGIFDDEVLDHPSQVLPSKWVDDAMQRYREQYTGGTLQFERAKQMSAMGVDVARGGRDKTVIARRHGWFWDELIKIPGKGTPDGESVASECIKYARDGCAICIDAGGVGASPYDILSQGYVEVFGVRGQETQALPDLGFNEKCVNMRSALWWTMRKILDPANKLEPILPDDNDLRAELTAPQFSESMTKFVVEKREEVKKRVGHSTDMADAVIYSLYNANDTKGSEQVYDKIPNIRLDDEYLYGYGENEGTWMSN